jgi:hypothetical protein
MMIVTLTAERTSFFHAERLSGLLGDGQILQTRQRLKDADRRDDCHGGLLFPPERGEHGLPFELRKRKILSTGSPSSSLRRLDESCLNLSCWIGRQQKFKTGPAESGLLRPTPHPPSLLESPDKHLCQEPKTHGNQLQL